MKQIMLLDKKFGKRLVFSVKEIYTNNNKKPLVDIIKHTLNEYGGELPYYSRANYLTKVSTNSLVIEIDINNQTKIDTVSDTILVLCNFLNSITSHEIKYSFFLSKPIGENKIEQNVYMAIDADKDFINSSLVDQLNCLVSNNKNLSKLIFPFQFDSLYRFSTIKIYESVAPIFHLISKIIVKDRRLMFNESFQMSFSFSIFYELKRIWFNNNSEEFQVFLNYLIECWLVYSYDDGLSVKTTDLLRKKESVLKKFNLMYSTQKKEIEDTYNNDTYLNNDLLTLLKKIPKNSEINNIPFYKGYLLSGKKNAVEIQKWTIYREVIFRILSILLIDNRYVSYIPFAIKKIEIND